MAMENPHFQSASSTGPFSIAMSVYWRVQELFFSTDPTCALNIPVSCYWQLVSFPMGLNVEVDECVPPTYSKEVKRSAAWVEVQPKTRLAI